ncbi:chromatin organization modifier domain-containing protein [Encephalitozoon hellem ATCC 50504]|uniref:Chromatin organization modifier domain-containing protein n=1 Tax=Encephalitozoon hellem TaxID=27973 RepID=A0A9Q9C936_ENCHE|nr:chromatin organization modifier domain-containing protein [Encephalitozoon hellem ATCC 50504]AFM97905.1 chromatin organization modifier domain-containing protein [Encephalitozoon hellem ATCC 50504]UTX42707.1 chromatin organization modifier domain-containing protein [Encephalitozoon hellem]WEL38166.1 chromobox protein [Encephalitozoon hellem]|eukprot:XP_003886886.1 chromatin organization modifier domain-containing protein [Encephalitozoon hellem ATCC 50504]
MKDGDIYIVDKIVGHRRRRGVEQYLVKWEGYPDSENTWEDEENIFCKELIREYEESQEKSKKGNDRVNKKKADPKKLSKKNPSRNGRDITNDWDMLVDRIISVEKNGPTLTVWLLFKDGKKDCFPASQVHSKCPLHLLEYYESNLVFCEDGVNDTK